MIETTHVTPENMISNNEKIAAPILDDFKIPATFYVCAGVINTKKMFISDRITKYDLDKIIPANNTFIRNDTIIWE